MTRTVAVTGFGILSPLGRGAAETTAALLAGRSGIVSMRPAWAEAGLRSQVAGYVDAAALRESFERKQARFLCDAAILAAEAMKDAIADSGLVRKEIEDPRTGIILGTGAGASMPDAIALGAPLLLTERTAPAAPAVNQAHLWVEDSAGKTRLMVRFNTGAAIQVAIEP